MSKKRKVEAKRGRSASKSTPRNRKHNRRETIPSGNKRSVAQVRGLVLQYFRNSNGEAVVAGGLGAFGGPVAAGISCAVVGTWNVGKAYYFWRKCKSRAKELL